MSVSGLRTAQECDYGLTVADFGPITKAGVTLQPLTVFVGPSNTGKSYLATLIYCLHQSFRNLVGSSDLADRDDRTPHVSDLREIGDWAKRVAGIQGEAATLLGFPPQIESHVRSCLESIPGVERSLDVELRRCFGVNRVRQLVRQSDVQASSVHVELPRPGGGGKLVYDLQMNAEGVQAVGRVHGSPTLPIDQLDAALKTRSLHPSVLQLGEEWPSHPTLPPAVGGDQIGYALRLLHQLTDAVRGWIWRPLTAGRPRYLPGNRAGMSHSRDILVSSLLHRATSGTDGADALLSGVSADFLDQLNRLTATASDLNPLNVQLAKRLENSILGGEVRVAVSDSRYPHVRFRPSGWRQDMPLMRTSSMVSELASVVVFLRHIVRPGDLLIIDEPEAHLHPGMQAVLAREVIRWVLSGFRVVVTTHSEWFLEQVANRVKLSSTPQERRTGIADPDVAIPPAHVGVWLFRSKGEGDGSFVDGLELDPETGLYPADHDAVSEALYNESARIFRCSPDDRGE